MSKVDWEMLVLVGWTDSFICLHFLDGCKHGVELPKKGRSGGMLCIIDMFSSLVVSRPFVSWNLFCGSWTKLLKIKRKKSWYLFIMQEGHIHALHSKKCLCGPRTDVQVFERLLKMNDLMQRLAQEERAKLGKAWGLLGEPPCCRDM